MKAPGKLAKAVIFVGVCLGLLGVFFASVVGDEWLRQYETYYIEFVDQPINGLEIGGAVQYRGINVGEVRDVGFSEDDSDVIVVEISAESDIPIRSNVNAAVEPVGISGISRLQLSGGSSDAPYLEPGDRLVAETSLFETLTGSAENVAGGVEQLVYSLTEVFDDANREEFSALLSSLRNTADRAGPGIISAAETMNDASSEVRQTVTNLNEIVRNLEGELSGLELAETGQSLNRSVDNLETIIEQSGRTVEEVDLTVEQNRQALTSSIRSFQRAMGSLSDIASQVNDDPSLLLRGRSGGSIR